MEDPKSYSIIIVPSDHSGTRQYQVTQLALVAGLIVLAMFTAVIVTFAATHLSVLTTARRVNLVESENEQLREDVAMIDELAGELEFLSAQRAQILNMLGGEDFEDDAALLPVEQAGETAPGTDPLSDVDRIQQLFADEARRSFAPRSWPASGPVRREFLPQPSGEVAAHRGIAVEVVAGEPIRAAGRGRVLESGLDDSGVPMLVLDHGYGFRTVYAGFARSLVSAGQIIERQQAIAEFDIQSPDERGGAGQIDGDALYFQIRVDGIAIDPREYLTPRQGRRRGS